MVKRFSLCVSIDCWQLTQVKIILSYKALSRIMRSKSSDYRIFANSICLMFEARVLTKRWIQNDHQITLNSSLSRGQLAPPSIIALAA